ncbi:hypothetical protein D3C80_1691070 [compost metagenome]
MLHVGPPRHVDGDIETRRAQPQARQRLQPADERVALRWLVAFPQRIELIVGCGVGCGRVVVEQRKLQRDLLALVLVVDRALAVEYAFL